MSFRELSVRVRQCAAVNTTRGAIKLPPHALPLNRMETNHGYFVGLETLSPPTIRNDGGVVAAAVDDAVLRVGGGTDVLLRIVFCASTTINIVVVISDDDTINTRTRSTICNNQERIIVYHMFNSNSSRYGHIYMYR